MSLDQVEIFNPESVSAWREWLETHHFDKQNVWLEMHSKHSDKPSISWSEAVDEALCYGWIDSKKVKVNVDTVRQYFCKRKPTSTWSKINKDKVEYLVREGRMTPAGLACVEIAKANGSWTLLNSAEKMIVPDDLEAALKKYNGAKEHFLAFSKSGRKSILQWLLLAKREETRQKRIIEVAELAQKGLKPKQFR